MSDSLIGFLFVVLLFTLVLYGANSKARKAYRKGRADAVRDQAATVPPLPCCTPKLTTRLYDRVDTAAMPAVQGNNHRRR